MHANLRSERLTSDWNEASEWQERMSFVEPILCFRSPLDPMRFIAASIPNRFRAFFEFYGYWWFSFDLLSLSERRFVCVWMRVWLCENGRKRLKWTNFQSIFAASIGPNARWFFSKEKTKMQHPYYLEQDTINSKLWTKWCRHHRWRRIPKLVDDVIVHIVSFDTRIRVNCLFRRNSRHRQYTRRTIVYLLFNL